MTTTLLHETSESGDTEVRRPPAPVLRAINLGKAYAPGRGKQVAMQKLFGGNAAKQEPRWVFRNISFDIQRGEAIGIIGTNGAGKSTLLKLLTSTSQASEGSVECNGNIAALLELGMGFHPDFTGRQNAYLAGQTQGRTYGEIDTVIEHIQEFAEIGDYFDLPLRTYSSGMGVRLAFAVATAFRPDILVVDEALAVGDAYFQHKSFARIRQFLDEGTTLLFVSHDPSAIKNLCTRAILMGDGKLMLDGTPDDVLDFYNAMIAERTLAHEKTQPEAFTGRSGNGRARYDAVDLIAPRTGVVNQGIFRVGEPMIVRLTYTAHEKLDELVAGVLIKDRVGADAFGTNTWFLKINGLGDQPGVKRTLDFAFEKLNLGPGSYSIATALHRDLDHIAENYDWWERAAIFQVVLPSAMTHFIGVSALPLKVTLDPLDAPPQGEASDSAPMTATASLAPAAPLSPTTPAGAAPAAR
jgi:lipopolysaccharide transport system ATP-binding protein